MRRGQRGRVNREAETRLRVVVRLVICASSVTKSLSMPFSMATVIMVIVLGSTVGPAEGRVARARAVASWTVPSMGALLTSRLPLELGLVEREDPKWRERERQRRRQQKQTH